jgi:serine/threonine protein kinase
MSQPLRYSRFEVLQHPDGSPQVLGEDAEITIYLAREKESGTPAVLRVPGHRAQRNPAERHRFLEEAQEMARVKHPHLAAVIHSSDTSAGAFCAMEFCDGLTLQKAIEEVGALPWQETFRLALQLSSALEALERHGLVHRGLRSTNIIVTTGADGHAHLKITEYGRVSEESIRDTLAATKSGFIRVPAYASPEEFLAVAPPDARSLQYSLGAVIWYCLTGKPLFEGTQFEVMFQHVNKEPDWNQLSKVPGAATAVMKLMLAKSAGDRFASCAALTAALTSATAGVTQAPKRAATAPQATLDAPISGPTALAWLKARQTLMLDEIHPML